VDNTYYTEKSSVVCSILHMVLTGQVHQGVSHGERYKNTKRKCLQNFVGIYPCGKLHVGKLG